MNERYLSIQAFQPSQFHRLSMPNVREQQEVPWKMSVHGSTVMPKLHVESQPPILTVYSLQE